KRLRSLGCSDCTFYLDGRESNAIAPEWEGFDSAVTTNLSAFFREPHLFPMLADFARRQPGPLTVWCAAASTGEEPYSIAMTLHEALGARASSCHVLATDIDTQVIEQDRKSVV